MPQPTPYEPDTSFLTFEAQQSWFPGHQLDAEFVNLDITLTEILANLALIQRDDGKVANQTIGWDQLTVDLRTTINTLTANNAATILNLLQTRPLEIAATTTTLVTDPLRTDVLTTGGYFSDYDCKGAAKYVLVQSENQSAAVELGGMRDVLFIQHVDRDAVDYVSLSRRVISTGIRVLASGYFNSGAWQQQTKDLTGGWFVAEGRTTGTFGGGTRGVSGILGESIQYGAGVATNEFGAFNPAFASEQSAQLVPVLAILSGKKGSADGSHTAIGFSVINLGKLATTGLQIISAGTDGDPGTYSTIIDASSATVTNLAINMPGSAGIEGTIIAYDPGDFSFYNRLGNAFAWTIGGISRFSGDAGNFFPSSNDGMALGTATLSWADLFLASGGVINWANGDVTLTHAANALAFAGAANGYTFDTAIKPASNDGAALGTTALQFSDLFLAEGGVINWDNGDVTITQTGNVLSFAGASTRYEFDANLTPTASDGAALGTSALMFSDLFLATGGVINFNNGNVTLTQAANQLTIAGVSSSFIVDAGSVAAAGEAGALRIVGGTAAKRLILGVDTSGTQVAYVQSIENAISQRTLQLNPLGGLVTVGSGGLDVAGLGQVDSFRIDQAASSVGTGAKTISNAADSSTNFGKYFSFNLNGTTVFVPCGTVAPT